MGFMAGQAGLGFRQGLMNRLAGVIFRIVALKAQVPHGCLKQFALGGGVGIVASDAAVGLERGMHDGLVHPDLLLGMAFVAALVAALLQQQLGDHAMAEVALLAVFLLCRGVHVGKGQHFFCKLGMAVQTLLLREPSTGP